jgi:hypothetical protein
MVPYGGHEFLFVRIVREHAISFIVTNVPLSKIFDHRHLLHLVLYNYLRHSTDSIIDRFKMFAPLACMPRIERSSLLLSKRRQMVCHGPVFWDCDFNDGGAKLF